MCEALTQLRTASCTALQQLAELYDIVCYSTCVSRLGSAIALADNGALPPSSDANACI
jgi:hypothetical protein